MKPQLLNAAGWWFRMLLRLYPVDFRDDMGTAMVETYRDRAKAALDSGSLARFCGVLFAAAVDSVRSGPGERVTPAASWRRPGNWGRDLEMARRRLRRSPLMVAAVIATLTVGLGSFAVVYAVVDKILIEPMPYKQPNDLYFAWRDYRAYFDLKRGWLAGTDVVALDRSGGVIEEAVGYQRQLWTLSERGGENPTLITVIASTPRLFDLLGVAPAMGRGFMPHEVGPGRRGVIVLTHELWKRLGANPAIVGTEMRTAGEPVTVIGVTAPGFPFLAAMSLGPPLRPEAFVTFNINLAETNPNNGSFGALIRARPGASPQVVAAAVDAVGKFVDTRDFQNKGLKLYPIGLKTDLLSRVRPVLVVLGLAGAFLVVMLMVNLSSVLLTRAAQREHEFAVSRALGANGAAMVRATLFEGALLGLMGGVAATTAAFWGTRALVALAPLDLPRREAVGVTWDVALVVIAVGVVLGVVAAAVPAAWAARASLASILAHSAVRGGGGGHGRMRRAMVVAQVALSFVLLVSGGLVVRSFERLLTADPGFRSDGMLTFRLPMPPPLVAPEFPAALALQDRIESALRAIPGVTGVSATTAPPLSGGSDQATVQVPGAPGNTGDGAHDAPLVDYYFTRGGYVETLGMRIVAGRPPNASRDSGVREMLVDRHFADYFFPSGSPIGATIPQSDHKKIIVGVVEQARLYDVHQDGRMQLIGRAEDVGSRGLSWVVRTTRPLDQVMPEVRAAVRAIAPQLPVADLKPMDEIVSNALRQQHVSVVLIAGFALGALLLAAMGLFGVVSAAVTRRRHELAVRLALGADHSGVLRLILGEGARLVGLGVLISVPGIYGASRVIRGMLIGVSPTDPLTLASVGAGLALVALAACYLPARRVLRIEPAQSLRQD